MEAGWWWQKHVDPIVLDPDPEHRRHLLKEKPMDFLTHQNLWTFKTSESITFIFKKAIEDCVIGKCMFNEWERKGFRSTEK